MKSNKNGKTPPSEVIGPKDRPIGDGNGISQDGNTSHEAGATAEGILVEKGKQRVQLADTMLSVPFSNLNEFYGRLNLTRERRDDYCIMLMEENAAITGSSRTMDVAAVSLALDNSIGGQARQEAIQITAAESKMANKKGFFQNFLSSNKGGQ